jgi:hypothetical protein
MSWEGIFGRTPVPEHLQELVDDGIPEGFRLEYKSQLGDGDKVLSGIAAMANTFGGVLIVGMDEADRRGSQGFGAPGPEGLIGVEVKERARLAGFCSSRLVPPYDPEITAVELPSANVALVVRVDADIAPRPLMLNNRILVRTEAGNRPADLFRLRTLFSEGPNAYASALSPGNPIPNHGALTAREDPADLVIRATSKAPLGASPFRPTIGDQQHAVIRGHLSGSKTVEWLSRMSGAWLGSTFGSNEWLPSGNNTSSVARLRWSAVRQDNRQNPVAEFSIELPSAQPTVSSGNVVTVTLDVILRLKNTLAGGPTMWRLPVEDLYYLLGALLQTFGEAVRPMLDECLDVDVGPLVGPSIGLSSGNERLDRIVHLDSLGLALIPGMQPGTGAALYASDIDLRDADIRRQQSQRWLREFLLDCHLTGVDRAVGMTAD